MQGLSEAHSIPSQPMCLLTQSASVQVLTDGIPREHNEVFSHTLSRSLIANGTYVDCEEHVYLIVRRLLKVLPFQGRFADT
jgi:hypothetical protein